MKLFLNRLSKFFVILTIVLEGKIHSLSETEILAAFIHI